MSVRLLDRWTAPHAQITEPQFRRILRLTAAWHLLTIPLGPLLGMIQLAVGEGDRIRLVWLVAAPVMTGLNYFLARTRYGIQALHIQVLSILGLVVWAIAVTPDRPVTIGALVIPVLAAALCFNLRTVLLYQAVVLCITLIRVGILPPEARGGYIGISVSMLAACVIVVAIVRHREWLVREQAMSAEREVARAKALLETAFDGIAMTERGVFTEVSSGFADSLGLSSEAMLRRGVDAVLPFRISTATQNQPVSFYDGDGALRFCKIVRHPLDDGVEVLAVRDATSEQLRRADLQFIDRMVSIGSVAAGVAHEVNNALMSMMGQCELGELAVERNDLERVRVCLESAQRSGGRIRDCVDGLQRFGGDPDEEAGPVDLNEAVRGTVQLGLHQLRHSAEFKLDLEPDLPMCRATETWVAQVVMNLLINASDSVRDGGGSSIWVSTFRDGDLVGVRVRDDGPGVPDEIRDQIFQPFFSTKGSRGSGLGLALCASIAARAGGQLRFEPAVEGASFCLLLQISDAVSEAEKPQSRSASRDQRVLVVDDELENGLVIRELMAPANVVVSTSVRDALEHLSEDYDLVLTDLVMPEASGLELVRFIREERPELARRIVLMTGSALEDLERVLEEPESIRVVRKPLRRNDLLNLLYDEPESP